MSVLASVRLVSSAYILGSEYVRQCGKSFIYIKNRIGPKIVPWGTPHLRHFGVDLQELMWQIWQVWARFGHTIWRRSFCRVLRLYAYGSPLAFFFRQPSAACSWPIFNFPLFFFLMCICIALATNVLLLPIYSTMYKMTHPNGFSTTFSLSCIIFSS